LRFVEIGYIPNVSHCGVRFKSDFRREERVNSHVTCKERVSSRVTCEERLNSHVIYLDNKKDCISVVGIHHDFHIFVGNLQAWSIHWQDW
jgi:DNA repair protein RadC